MKANSSTEKYIEFIKKKVTLSIHANRPSAFYGRVQGEKVLFTAIPKAGTNLVYQLLYHLPNYRIYTGRGLRPWMMTEGKLIKKINNIQKGQIIHGHLPAMPSIIEAAYNNNVKVISIIRDPRDVLLSHLKYVTYLDKTHKTHHFFKSLSSNDERIKALLYGEPNIVEPIAEVFSKYEGWFNYEDICIIRFENLIGKKGGGNNEKQMNEILKIINLLKLNLSDHLIAKLAKRIYNEKSATFRSGIIGQWKSSLEPHQIKLIKPVLNETLIKLGYEKDDNW